MPKYKIEIDLDLDFEKIFSEIPEGLFEKGDGPDEYYYREIIYDSLKDCYLYALEKNMNDLASDKKNGLYKYLKHHNLCSLQVSKQISKNIKLTKIE